MGEKVYLFMFIDAMGWEILKNRDFLKQELPYRKAVNMQLGYSCTAIPTILTGQPPVVHKHFTFYYYDPQNSPFKIFKYLKYLPKQIFSRWRVRHLLSKMIAKHNGYTGYFEMYAMPFDRIQYFNYAERTDLFEPGGLYPTPNLADLLVEKNIPYHISNWRHSESENIEAMKQDLKRGDIEFAFLYTADLDALLHRVTKDGKEITAKINWYASHIKEIMNLAAENYEDYEMYVFSDHGMTSLAGTVDAKQHFEKLNLKFGNDYVAVYDSTLVHFWFFNNQARRKIMLEAQVLPHSHILNRQEKQKYGIDFSDDMYGEEIILMDPGYQIEPSDMGLKALPAMHGFSPEHHDSKASFLGTNDPEISVNWVGDYFQVMKNKIEKLKY
ncbi:MAG TPA: hypothetical protein DHM37_04995 [Candidatus Cloacimonas sp.]|nr:hypothetical protein [Candidatus Cloacimonas sp.]